MEFSSFNVYEHTVRQYSYQYTQYKQQFNLDFIFTLYEIFLQPCIHYTFNDDNMFHSLN